MRGVEQLAERAGVPRFAAPPRRRPRARSPSRRGGRGGRAGPGRPAQSVGVAQRLDSEQLGGRAGTRRGARCSRTRRGSASCPSRARRARGRRGRARPGATRACACRAAPPGPPRRGSRRAGRAARSPRRCTRSRSAGRGARARRALAAPRRRRRTSASTSADAERGRRREAGLLREVALHVDRAAREVHAGGAQLGHGAAEVGVVVREPGRDDLAAVAQFRCHRDPAIDREGQAKAEVVIGVLADQIHASRRESPDPVRVHGRHPTAARARPWTHGGERAEAIAHTFDR